MSDDAATLGGRLRELVPAVPHRDVLSRTPDGHRVVHADDCPRCRIEALVVELARLVAHTATHEAAHADPEHTYWLIHFEDAERGVEVYTDERSARTRSAMEAGAWNHTLFVEARALDAARAALAAVGGEQAGPTETTP